MRPAGTTSVTTVPAESSLPVLATTMVYSRSSPAATTPPFTSLTDFVDVVKSGLKVEIDVTNAPRK